MRVLEECINESKAFLPSLEELAKQALENGEDCDMQVFVFHGNNENGELIAATIITGSDVAITGAHENLVTHPGYTLNEFLMLSPTKTQ